jgi:tRNA 2-selenouridine synthase
MAELISIEQFLTLSAKVPVIDVRSPSEHDRGHIPGAVNIPLFDDMERRVVGTKYRQVNREAATFAALEFAGKKLASMAGEGKKKAGRDKQLLVHCWRGGMRSKSMAWLFETLDIQCYVLEGGYRAYRRHLREVLRTPFCLRVIGGGTGSGKTDLLHHLRGEGAQVVDLESIAHHKGSAFGSLGETVQPTTEQFENDLHGELARLDETKLIWVEDESRNIGRCVIPEEFFSRMLKSELIFLDIPREERARYLVKHYGSYDLQMLKSCILKIEKKLGGERTGKALECIDRQDLYHAVMITLEYYDKSYLYSLKKNHMEYAVIRSDTVDAVTNSRLIHQQVRPGHES